MKLTPFGREVRGLRMDNARMLKDLAEHLKVSESYVSAVEFGRRAVPEEWPERIAQFFALAKDRVEQLRVLSKSSNKSLSIDMEGLALPQIHRDTAAIFAMDLPRYTEEEVKKIKQCLEELRYEKPWARGSSAVDRGGN